MTPAYLSTPSTLMQVTTHVVIEAMSQEGVPLPPGWSYAHVGDRWYIDTGKGSLDEHIEFSKAVCELVIERCKEVERTRWLSSPYDALRDEVLAVQRVREMVAKVCPQPDVALDRVRAMSAVWAV